MAFTNRASSTLLLYISIVLFTQCTSGDSDGNTPKNTPPEAHNQNITTEENTNCIITLSAQDKDNDPLSYQVTELPLHGTLTEISDNTFEYTPSLNYAGTDQFTFYAFDITDQSNNAVVSIQVGPINMRPVSYNLPNLEMDSNTTIDITLNATDPDGDDALLEYEILAQPSNGTLSPDPISGNTGNLWTYTPNPNYSGIDSFTYRSFDGENHSDTATATITVLNGIPIAIAPTGLATAEDTPLNITLQGTDPESNTLTFHISADDYPEHGTIELQTGETTGSPLITYTPDLNYNGSDSFSFYVQDSFGSQSLPVIATISVSPTGDNPIAQTQTILITENVAGTITLTGQEPDGEAITYSIQTSPASGSLTPVGSTSEPEWIYTPNANFRGIDTFTFLVTDSGGNSSSPVEIRLYIKPANVHFVRANAQSSGDGTFWNSAFTHPQQAINTANAGDEIWIAQGTYTEELTQRQVISCRTDITIVGGFNIDPDTETYAFTHSQSDPDTYPTVLDGSANSIHTCIGADNTTLIGLTITGGFANDNPDNIKGGGLILNNGSMVINNCLFSSNRSAEKGGAIAALENTSLTLTDCKFQNNTAIADGGALYLSDSASATIDRCFFNNNIAESGNEFIRSSGGAIYAYTNSSINMRNSQFWSNSANENGGAVCGLGSITSVNNLFINNVAQYHGGALCQAYGALTINHCTFTQNQGDTGGVIYRYTGPEATVTNSILRGNIGSTTEDRVVNDNGDGTSVAYSFIDQWSTVEVWDPDLMEYVTVITGFYGFIDSGNNTMGNPQMIIDLLLQTYSLDPLSSATNYGDDGRNCGFLPAELM